MAQRFQFRVFRIAEKIPNGLPVGKSEEYQSIRLPVALDHLEVSSANNILTAVFGDQCGNFGFILLKTFGIMQV